MKEVCITPGDLCIQSFFFLTNGPIGNSREVCKEVSRSHSSVGRREGLNLLTTRRI